MDNKIYMSIPDFWSNWKLNTELIKMMKEHPSKFNDGVIIDSVYGSFPCIWNGGRYITGNTNKNNIVNTVKSFNDLGVSVRHTFTNINITEEYLNDRVGNTILSLTEKLSRKVRNGVNVSQQCLADYINKNYGDFYILYSTTLNISTVEDINKISENNIIVPSYEINNNFDILNQLTNKDNVEILIGEACVDNCPNRKKHHKGCSDMQMMMDGDGFKCPFGCEANFNYYDTIPTRKHYISIDDIYEKYLPLGFNKFKISGRRDNKINVVERYINYLVKPEFQNDVRNRLLMIVIN